MLYHENQVAALCGVHCLNTLLQGPYFSEIELAQIAQGLDELERALVGDGALGEASGNVAMDGMFSIQVLSRALESWGLQVVSLESQEATAFKAAPTTATAFICNLQEHWFTLRRVTDGEWWNFNSLFPAPQPLSTFYLQAFLDTLRGEGWTIFVVTGQFPAAQPGSLDQLPNASGRWWSPEESRSATEEAERARKRGRVANALEGAFARADQQGGRVQLRTRGAAVGGRGAGVTGAGPDGDGDFAPDGEAQDDDEDADLAAAIAASLQSHQPQPPTGQPQPPTSPGRQAGGANPPPGGEGGSGGGGDGAADGMPYDMMYGDDDDPELAMAIAASLADSAGGGGGSGGGGEEQQAAPAGQQQQEQQRQQQQAVVPEPPLDPEPEEGEGVIEVAFRLPSGSRSSRRFTSSSPSAALFSFLAPLLGVAPGHVVLSTTFPKKELERSPTTTLADLGLTNRTLLVAEPRR